MKIFTKIKKMLKFGLDTDRGVYKTYWHGLKNTDNFVYVKVANATNITETYVLAIEPLQFELAKNRGKMLPNLDPSLPTINYYPTEQFNDD